MNAVTIPLESRRLRRARGLQKLNHAIPAAGLIVAGAQAVAAGAHGVELTLAIVEIVTSVVLVALILRSVRPPRHSAGQVHGGPHAVDWVDIWAAAVLFAEAAERWHVRHHPPRPMLMTAVVTLALGLFHGRLARWGERRRALRISGEDLYLGGRPFRAFRARRRDLAAIELDPLRAVIRTRSGRVRRLDLADLDNADEVRRALEQLRTQIVRRPADAAEPTPPSRR